MFKWLKTLFVGTSVPEVINEVTKSEAPEPTPTEKKAKPAAAKKAPAKRSKKPAGTTAPKKRGRPKKAQS